MTMFTCKFVLDEVTYQRLRVGSKKHALSLPEGSVQQGRSHFYARSVCVIREHGKMVRTPLTAFFNRPEMYSSFPRITLPFLSVHPNSKLFTGLSNIPNVDTTSLLHYGYE